MAEPTPSPTPSIEETLGPIRQILDATTPGAMAFAVGVALVLGAAGVLAYAIIKAAQFPAPTALITSLSLLTLFATAGGIATNNDAAWTIAAAGVGALAGSVTALFQQENTRMISKLPPMPAQAPPVEPAAPPEEDPHV